MDTQPPRLHSRMLRDDLTLDDGKLQLWEGWDKIVEAEFDTPFTHENWIDRNALIVRKLTQIIYEEYVDKITRSELLTLLNQYHADFERPYRYGTPDQYTPRRNTGSRNGLRDFHYVL